MKVKVYDIIKVISDLAGEKFYGSEANALIVGEYKAILVDEDATHTIHELKEGLRLTAILDTPAKVQGDLIVSSVKKSVRLSFDMLQRAEPLKEVELGTFVRTFGNRIETNYKLLLDSIKEIGLDPNDYPRKVGTND